MLWPKRQKHRQFYEKLKPSFTIWIDRRSIDLCHAGAIAKSGSLYKGRRETQIWREIKMADDEELYLANLDEFVNDEDKIVSLLLVHGESSAFKFLNYLFFFFWMLYFRLPTNG